MSERPSELETSERRRALRKARESLRPSSALTERLERALVQAESAPRPLRKSAVKRLWLQAPLMLPAAFGVLIALYVTFDSPTFDALNVAEHSLEIPDGKGASIALDLALHHHGDDWTDVALHAPRGVSVSARAIAVEPAACRGNRCRYQLGHQGASGAPEMRLHVSEPGRYRMEIEHQSRSARIREVFVIHARR